MSMPPGMMKSGPGLPPGATPTPKPPLPNIDPSAPGAGLLQQALSGLDPQQQQVVMAALSDPMVLETILTLAAAGSMLGGAQGEPAASPDPNAMFGPAPR